MKPRSGNMPAQTIDGEHAKGKEDAIPQVRNFECIRQCFEELHAATPLVGCGTSFR